ADGQRARAGGAGARAGRSPGHRLGRRVGALPARRGGGPGYRADAGRLTTGCGTWLVIMGERLSAQSSAMVMGGGRPTEDVNDQPRAYRPDAEPVPQPRRPAARGRPGVAQRVGEVVGEP